MLERRAPFACPAPMGAYFKHLLGEIFPVSRKLFLALVIINPDFNAK
jgi:hypothetical protein